MAHWSSTYTQKNDLVRTLGEGHHVQTRKRRLTRNQICLQLDHEHPASRSVKKKKKRLSHLACDILLEIWYSSVVWLPQQGCSKNQRAQHLGMSLPQRGTEQSHGRGGTSIHEKLSGDILSRWGLSAEDADVVPRHSCARLKMQKEQRPGDWCETLRRQVDWSSSDGQHN